MSDVNEVLRQLQHTRAQRNQALDDICVRDSALSQYRKDIEALEEKVRFLQTTIEEQDAQITVLSIANDAIEPMGEDGLEELDFQED